MNRCSSRPTLRCFPVVLIFCVLPAAIGSPIQTLPIIPNESNIAGIGDSQTQPIIPAPAPSSSSRCSDCRTAVAPAVPSSNPDPVAHASVKSSSSSLAASIAQPTDDALINLYPNSDGQFNSHNNFNSNTFNNYHTNNNNTTNIFISPQSSCGNHSALLYGSLIASIFGLACLASCICIIFWTRSRQWQPESAKSWNRSRPTSYLLSCQTLL
ncbi:hypothetical protein C8J56DRAFT_922822 [Mycena floridula]|nr:hypothetical protein C8J56DRAFT_922822 [Mycena floridula]